jgi:hypothetical protein
MELAIQVNADVLNIEYRGKWEAKQKDTIDRLTKKYLADLWSTLGSQPSIVEGHTFLQFHPFLCCICLQPCTKKNTVMVPCGCKNVFYHQKCLRQWYSVKKICPTCRYEVVESPPYETVKLKNPFKEEEAPKTMYQCDGSTHPRKSKYVRLDAALEHIRVKHKISISREGAPKEGYRYRCSHGECTGVVEYTNQALLRHLIADHQCKVLTPITKEC